MKRTSVRLSVMALMMVAMLSSGCSLNDLGKNIWVGFGESLGGVPANLVIEASSPLIRDLLGIDITPGDGDDNGDEQM